MNTEGDHLSDVTPFGWRPSVGLFVVGFFLEVGGVGWAILTQICVCTLATEAIDVTVTLTKIVIVVNATFL